jgi:hypothetical protein
MKRTTLDSLLRIYERLEDLVTELYILADTELELEAFEHASLFQSRADILYEQMENLAVVISEIEE